MAPLRLSESSLFVNPSSSSLLAVAAIRLDLDDVVTCPSRAGTSNLNPQTILLFICSVLEPLRLELERASEETKTSQILKAYRNFESIFYQAAAVAAPSADLHHHPFTVRVPHLDLTMIFVVLSKTLPGALV